MPTTPLRGRLDPTTAPAFMLAGCADVTLQNDETGSRFTYRISAPKKDTPRGGRVIDREAEVRFVAVLTGQDNEADYTYLGTIRNGGPYAHGRKSRVSEDAPSVEVFAWAWERLLAGDLPPTVSVWHEGRCGRCSRKLTVPESVATGYGPECSGLLGIDRVTTTVGAIQAPAA